MNGRIDARQSTPAGSLREAMEGNEHGAIPANGLFAFPHRANLVLVDMVLLAGLILELVEAGPVVETGFILRPHLAAVLEDDRVGRRAADEDEGRQDEEGQLKKDRWYPDALAHTVLPWLGRRSF